MANTTITGIGYASLLAVVGVIASIGIAVRGNGPAGEPEDSAPSMSEQSSLTWEDVLESPKGKWAMNLLGKNAEDWSGQDQKKAPAIYDWLKNNEGVLDFPWKWDVEDINNDQNRYKKAWRRCFEAEREKWVLKRDAAGRQIKDGERDCEELKRLHDHLTNEMAHVNHQIASAEYPLIVKYTRIEKRKYWFGEKKVPVVKECRNGSDSTSVVGELQNAANEFQSKITNLEAELGKLKSTYRVCDYWVDVADIADKEVNKLCAKKSGDQDLEEVSLVLQLRLLGLITADKKFISFALTNGKW